MLPKNSSMTGFELLFVDRDKLFIDDIRHKFRGVPEARCLVADIASVPRKNTGFVSPANSLGFMDGGVDYAYSRRMFPGVERAVRAKISSLGLRTALGRPYLPVGSAVVVPVKAEEDDVHETACLVAAPTMFLPHDVSGTRNAYHAFMAALCAFDRYRSSGPRSTYGRRYIRTLVCPAMCTGWGQMSVWDAAQQMRQAYDDFVLCKKPQERPRAGTRATDDCVFLAVSKDDEQPDNYDTREIKTVPLSALA